MQPPAIKGGGGRAFKKVVLDFTLDRLTGTHEGEKISVIKNKRKMSNSCDINPFVSQQKYFWRLAGLI